MHVVVDTNILFADFAFKSESFRVLSEGVRRTDLRLRIPQVVFDEAVNKYREECIKLYSAIKNSLQRYDSFCFTPLELELPSADLEEEVEQYAERLRKWCAAARGKLMLYPRETHKEVVRRELSRRRPFQQNGSGYRDCLIWLTILRLLRSGSDGVYFITANTKDFNDGHQLHPDLVADLTNAKIPRDSVRLFSSLADFNARVIIPGLASVTEIRNRIEADRDLRQSFREWIGGALGPHIEGNNTKILEQLRILDRNAKLRLRRAGRVRNFRVADVRQLSDQQVVVVTEADAVLNLVLTYSPPESERAIDLDLEEQEEQVLFSALHEREDRLRVEPFLDATFVFDFRRWEIQSLGLRFRFQTRLSGSESDD
jgi:hypothetical protein